LLLFAVRSIVNIDLGGRMAYCCIFKDRSLFRAAASSKRLMKA
jgi:hypothetical protein